LLLDIFAASVDMPDLDWVRHSANRQRYETSHKGETAMTRIGGRATLPCLSPGGEIGSNRQTRKGMSIVLIDRRTLTRQRLSQRLQEKFPDLRVVAVANSSDLLDASQSLSAAHLIAFNIGAASVRDSDVLGQIAWLQQRMPRVPVALLADRDDVEHIVEAIGHGVRGYIPTSLQASEAAAAIQCIAAGGTFVPAYTLIRFAQIQESGSKRGLGEGSKGLFESLTPRESEVLARLTEGKPNKVIAHELDIRESTVKEFVRRILGKLHASNRTELALLSRARLR
jgi:DNA-binding NarL/FixJ family response regulator